jgi:hypothetical protein
MSCPKRISSSRRFAVVILTPSCRIIHALDRLQIREALAFLNTFDRLSYPDGYAAAIIAQPTSRAIRRASSRSRSA